MFEELGSSSKACHLYPAGVLSATAAVQRDIANGCDFALLSKFGRLEAEGSGLVDAFTAAVEAGVPVLTSVSPAFEPALTRYAAPSFRWVGADIGAIEDWMRAHLVGCDPD